mmetsp:Transcript_54676/g.106947  ORF Transcript_54676/g.106947 Transcript_54676/m.106947 type:complete len:96 (+) Transcript_54676:955-1242(+)
MNTADLRCVGPFSPFQTSSRGITERIQQTFEERGQKDGVCRGSRAKGGFELAITNSITTVGNLTDMLFYLLSLFTATGERKDKKLLRIEEKQTKT